MKKFKNIALATCITLITVSCKKEASTATKEIASTKKEIKAENLETANFTIDGMTCAVGCAKTIESKLNETEGVQEAVVDFESKIATVSYDKTKLNVTSLTSTIEKVAGGDAYKVSKAEVKSVK
ncbi:MAG: heavy-metal-associated domain-containing protein [Flavobacterium sp.]|nr:heavy-metal-associated domain-containing protein [Flavobacterium sp.]